MISFEVIDIILFLGLSQGVFLAIVLQTIHNRNKSANKVLSEILLLAAFMLFGRIVYFRLNNELLEQIAFAADTVIFVFGPMIYLYVRRLTFYEPKIYKLPLSNYLPAVVFAFFLAWTFSYTKEEYALVLKANNIKLSVVYKSISALAIISNGYYLFKAFKLNKLYQQREEDNISYSQYVSSFVYTFLTTISVIIFLWFVNLVNQIFSVKMFPMLNYEMVWTSLSILVYLVGYYSLKQPQVFRVNLKTNIVKKPIKQRLNIQTLDKLNVKLKKLMNEEKIYLNNELTLRNLAEKLDTSSNNVSWLINSVYQCTFYEYVNRFRIEEFIRKIENGAHEQYTVLALSMESGFNSKSTFNKAFKNEMKDTPTNYIRKLS